MSSEKYGPMQILSRAEKKQKYKDRPGDVEKRESG